MKFSLLTPNRKEQFVVIDSTFPQAEPFAFRNSEISEYFKRIRNFESYTMYPMAPGRDAWFHHGYGMTPEEFSKNKQGYLRYYPENEERIHYLAHRKAHSFGLSYSYFLSETYVLLPFLEQYHIPFVFVLYPGGGFGLDFEKSDQMLTKIFKSRWFRGVIVTQQITKDYLLRKGLCEQEKIVYIYGGFVQFKKQDILARRYYGKEKRVLDICFVAAKYSPLGEDKGYDLFIKVAKQICGVVDDVQFHVIGGFNESDIDVRDIRSRMTFYGYQRADALRNIYATMDIFLSPNRPFKLFKGNFDGFPLGIDASYCGVALFVTDELGMNNHYVDGEDIVILPLDASKIAEIVLQYRKSFEQLHILACKGQQRTQDLFDIDYQINERIKVFKQFVNLELIT